MVWRHVRTVFSRPVTEAPNGVFNTSTLLGCSTIYLSRTRMMRGRLARGGSCSRGISEEDGAPSTSRRLAGSSWRGSFFQTHKEDGRRGPQGTCTFLAMGAAPGDETKLLKLSCMAEISFTVLLRRSSVSWRRIGSLSGQSTTSWIPGGSPYEECTHQINPYNSRSNRS